METRIPLFAIKATVKPTAKLLAVTLLAACALSLGDTGQVRAAPSMALNGEVYNDWTMRCSEVNDPQTQQQVAVCEATQRIVNDQGQPVMEVIVTLPPGQNQYVGAIIAPLGVVLPAGIAVSVDGTPTGKIPFVRCIQQGCIGQFAFQDNVFNAWKGGVQATVTVVRGNNTEVALPLSLSGFTAATDALR